jgi:hypothetical protein
MRYWSKDVVVDPYDATQNTWYAGVFSGWGGPPNDLGGLYKTTNRGVSWTRIVTLNGVTSVTFNPSDQNEAYMTTETRGLWFSSNMRTATPTFAAVSSYPFRQPERVFFNPFNPSEIWVTSFGGGVRVGTTAVAPQVNSFRVNDGALQRSMVTSLTVTFSTQVTLGQGAFTLVPQGGGTPVALSFTTAVNNGQTVATITFGGSLADGRYVLTTVAAQVRDLASGTQMTADRQDSLYRFFGDVNGDSAVNGLDLAEFRTAFGTTSASPNYRSYLDLNGDGAVNGLDLAEFRTHFGTTLP